MNFISVILFKECSNTKYWIKNQQNLTMVDAQIPQNPFMKCYKSLKCGHACNGVIGESECCLPC